MVLRAQSHPDLCITPLGPGLEIYWADRDSVDRIGEGVASTGTHEPDDTLSPLLRYFLDDVPVRDDRRRP